MKNTSKNSWTEEEEEQLYTSFMIFGCSWTNISQKIPSHNGIQIKNKIYSTIRTGFRKINTWIKVVKRKIDYQHFHGQKVFEPIVINKLMAVIDKNFERKFDVKSQANELCKQILEQLIELGKSSKQFKNKDSYLCYKHEEILFSNIRSFNKNCRRKRQTNNNYNQKLSKEQSRIQIVSQSFLRNHQKKKNQIKSNISSRSDKEQINGKELQISINFMEDSASNKKYLNHTPDIFLENNFLESQFFHKINNEFLKESDYYKSQQSKKFLPDSSYHFRISANNIFINPFKENSMIYESESHISQPYYFQNHFNNSPSVYNDNLINNANIIIDQKDAFGTFLQGQNNLYNSKEVFPLKLSSLENDLIQTYNEKTSQNKNFFSEMKRVNQVERTQKKEKNKEKFHRYTEEIQQNNKDVKSCQSNQF